MKRKKILTKVTALMLSFAVILSSNITYAEIYGYNENVEYFLPYDNYNNIIINDVSEDEMEQIRKAAEINQELIKESLSTKKHVTSRTQYKFSSDYFYNQMTDDEKNYTKV